MSLGLHKSLDEHVSSHNHNREDKQSIDGCADSSMSFIATPDTFAAPRV